MQQPVRRKKQAITLRVNGVEHDGLVEPRRLLCDFIREDLGLTGTHVGCEHGICGACTVLVNGAAMRCCLLFAIQADGSEIMTVEGLARGGELHPLQEAFWENHGLQCGFCTPGVLMAAYEFLRDIRPLLEESGVKVIAPAWWNQPLGRLGARLQIEAPPGETAVAGGHAGPSVMGLNAIVRYRWQIAIGDQPLSREEFEALAAESAPLVRSSYHARDQVPGAELKALRRRQATVDGEGRVVPLAG